MKRRSFLALFGCGVVGLATDWSGALDGVQSAPVLTGRIAIYEIMLMGDRLQDADMLSFMVRGTPMIGCGLNRGGCFRWVSMPDSEILHREQDQDVYLAGEQSHRVDWGFHWRLLDGCASVTGCEYCGRAFYVWPAGGHCLSCGGALPAPLVGGKHFLTMVRDGQRAVTPLEMLKSSPDLSCDYCGAQTVDGECLSCGAIA